MRDRSCSWRGAAPRSCGKSPVERSRGRQPGTQVSSVTTSAFAPAASARCTRLSASATSVGVYSWKSQASPPDAAATSSSRSSLNVLATIGTPVSAAALAVARSPCRSGAAMPTTPTGAMNTGEGSACPKSSTPSERSVAPTSIRGTRPQWPKASTFARCVRSSPAPPAMYDQVPGALAASAAASSASAAIGYAGSLPCSPREVDLELIVAECRHRMPPCNLPLNTGTAWRGWGLSRRRSRARGSGRYWDRTSDLFRVREARYRCANRPCSVVRSCDQRGEYRIRTGVHGFAGRCPRLSANPPW